MVGFIIIGLALVGVSCVDIGTPHWADVLTGAAGGWMACMGVMLLAERSHT